MCNRQVVSLVAACAALALIAGASCGQGAGPGDPTNGLYSLEQFGPVATAAEADAALKKAGDAIIAAGGGVLVIPRGAPAGWKPENVSQYAWRKPAPPAPASQGWGQSAGVTLLDYRDGTVKVYVPQATGLELVRTLRMEGQGMGHWGTYPMLTLEERLTRGSASYRDWMTQDVKAGEDARVYPRTMRGIFPGMFLNTNDGNDKLRRIYVKALGFDKERNAPYFTTSIDIDTPVKGTLLHNKSNTSLLHMESNSHVENQTMDVTVDRHNYSQGDNYLFFANFNYMSDVHSTAGDENGVCYAAFVHGECNVFRGQVDGRNAQAQEVKYTAAANAHTLGSGRPLINLNPKKWVAGGSVVIVRPIMSSEYGRKDVTEPVFEGRKYPTTLVTGEYSGIPELRLGGLIRFSKDAPVTKEVVGRYFAVDEKDEYVPGGSTVRRWYLIDQFTANPDGTKQIVIIRHWWGAHPAAAPTLYNPGNYTEDGHVKPLRYIIAPGANVYDVSRGVKSGPENSGGALERVLLLTPGPDDGAAFDFAAGDFIEQAIGPDPWNPIPFRSWVFEKVPGPFPNPMIDLLNWGDVSRYAAMTVGGGPASLTDIGQRADKRTPWEKIIEVASACENGIVFGADVAGSALLFRQPNARAQPIAWLYEDGAKKTTLSVSPQDGTVRIEGGAGTVVNGGVGGVSGLSGTAVMAKNLRGVNIPVPEGAKELAVAFPTPEPDARYAAFVELTWLTEKAVCKRAEGGFTVKFATPAGKGEELSWLLVR